MAKQIVFNEEAREKIKKGIDKLAEAVRMTLGPRGRAVVIEKSYGTPQVTFDGVTVAKEVELQDKYENLGAEFIKQAADKTNDMVGDGTTTAVVLAHAMIEEGERAIEEKGYNVIQLADAVREGSNVIIKTLETEGKQIDDPKKIKEVAILSSKNKDIGELIATIMEKIGKEGVVAVEDSNSIGNSYEIVEGLQFDRGYVSAYMMTNADRMEAVLEDPYILVTDKKISAVQEMLPVLEKVIQSGKKELVVIADEIEGEALATLVVNKLRGVFNVLAVKAPGFGDRRKEMLEDIAIVTGAQFISEDLGRKLENVELSDLGHAHRVISNKDTTTIVGGKGDKKAIEERIAQLKAQIKKTDSDFDKEKLQERLGKLSGGVAVIKIGAPTESAQKELKERVEDAVSATRAAMEEGIVPGGGVALFNIWKLGVEYPTEEKYKAQIFRDAIQILLAACGAPIAAIVDNSGKASSTVLNELAEQKMSLWESQKKEEAGWLGFNALTNEIADLKTVGIIDPLKVVRTAFLNAVSVAANYLTVGAAITEIPEKKEKGMPGMGGMGEEY